MQVLQCDLTLLENTFFSSREIGNFYQTEPVIGNYALCYAMGLATASYFNSGTIHYAEHLAALNVAGVYVTPAAYNGQSAFCHRNVQRPAGQLLVCDGQQRTDCET